MVSKKFLLWFRHIAVDSDQESPPQSTYIYKEYHSVLYVSSSELGRSQPLSHQQASVPCPPESGAGGGAHSPAGEGLGGPNSDDLRKSLALSLLCEVQQWEECLWIRFLVRITVNQPG